MYPPTEEFDDVARTLAAHMRQHRAGDAEQAEYIRAEQLVRLRRAGFLDRAEQAVAGIVDQMSIRPNRFTAMPAAS